MPEPGRWKLSDLKQLIECSTAASGQVISELRSAATILEDEESTNFIFGKVIIENDLLNEEADDGDDDE
jgi:hypothetical protein